jgi:hypothetical protein
MPLPQELDAELQSVNGTSCGTPGPVGNMELAVAEPPEYYRDSGDFSYMWLGRVDLGGGNYTWELRLRYAVSGDPCSGLYIMRLVTASSDPEGDYGVWNGSTVDTSKGEAVVWEP